MILYDFITCFNIKIIKNNMQFDVGAENTLTKKFKLFNLKLLIKMEVITMKGETHIIEDSFLKDLELLKAIEQKEEKVTLPEIFEKEDKENFISDYLAIVLHPSKNGVGNLILRKLIELYEKRSGRSLKRKGLAFSNIAVKREYTLDKNNRIDILIESDAFVIGIENKVKSVESVKQTERYAEILKQIFPKKELILFYLTLPAREKPSSEEFIHITYKDLLEILENIKVNEIKDYSKFIYCWDFLLFIKRRFVMELNQLKLKPETLLYLRNEKDIHKILQAYKEDLEKFQKMVKNIINEFLPEEIWEIESEGKENRDEETNEYSTTIHFKIRKKKWKNEIYYELEFPDGFNSEKTLFYAYLDFNKKELSQILEQCNKFYQKAKYEFENKKISYQKWGDETDENTLAYKEYPLKRALKDGISKSELESLIKQIKEEFEFIEKFIDTLSIL